MFAIPGRCGVAGSPVRNIPPVLPVGAPAVAKLSSRRVCTYLCRQIDQQRSIPGSRTASAAHQTSVDSSMPPIVEKLWLAIQQLRFYLSNERKEARFKLYYHRRSGPSFPLQDHTSQGLVLGRSYSDPHEGLSGFLRPATCEVSVRAPIAQTTTATTVNSKRKFISIFLVLSQVLLVLP